MFLRKSFAVLCIVVFVVAVFSLGIRLVVAGPPSSGDWTVTGTESYSDQTIVLNGSLFVENGGNLTFRRVTLKMNCAYDGQWNITVRGGGKFYVLDGSIITSVDQNYKYAFAVESDSTFRMNNSELHECGWVSTRWQTNGLQIHSDDAIVENSLISHNLNGIDAHKSGIIIRNNNITTNDGLGVSACGGHSPTIYNNYIAGNNGPGILADPHSSPTIYKNTITSNSGGIHFWDGANPIIQDNIISLNNGSGISFSNSSPTIQDNSITSNKDSGILCKQGSNPIIQGNNITQNNEEGIFVDGYSNATIQYNTISSNNDHGIVLINSYSFIQYNNVFSNCHSGICVGSSNATIERNSIAEHDETGILCWDNSTAIVKANNITENINGIWLFGSNLVIDGNSIRNIGMLGEGIGCRDFSSSVIQSNNITSCDTGIECQSSSSPTIEKNEISTNRVGIALSRSNAFIQANIITSNNDTGISIGEYSNATVRGNIIAGNQIGIEIHSNSTPTVQANDITSNTNNGVIFTKWAYGLLQGNLIAKTSEGIVVQHYCNPIIQGNQILNGGIFCFDKSQPEIHWNDIYDGATNGDPTVIINATYNYWGSPEGPKSLPQNTLYHPWLAEPIVFAEITNPLVGETVSATVTISTNARAKNGIYKVEFYIDDQLEYSDLDSPYEWSWDTAQYNETSHEITAKAYDIFGLKFSVSRSVFVDNTSPTASIQEPLSGNTCSGMVTISVNATDNREVGNVRVKIDNGDWLVMTYNSTDSLWKYDLNTTTLYDGQHTIMSLALDKAGNPATTSITVLVDNNPPTLTIQSPTSGMTVGLTLTVNVQASDVSNISRVEFYLHNVLVSTAYTTPYQWAWDTTRYPNGQYTVTVKAYDSIGNVQSREVTVTVNNVEVPWWQAHFWTIIQAVIALGTLILGIIAYWSRTKEKRRKRQVSPRKGSNKQVSVRNT